ncbi:MAG: hypothetical protein AB8B97_09855 [Granulosicoccus sp.]
MSTSTINDTSTLFKFEANADSSESFLSDPNFTEVIKTKIPFPLCNQSEGDNFVFDPKNRTITFRVADELEIDPENSRLSIILIQETDLPVPELRSQTKTAAFSSRSGRKRKCISFPLGDGTFGRVCYPPE